MRSASSPPTSDVTFLFTDIEGSTALWDRAPEAMTESLAEHDRRINSIVVAHNVGLGEKDSARSRSLCAMNECFDALQIRLDDRARRRFTQLHGDSDEINKGSAAIRRSRTTLPIDRSAHQTDAIFTDRSAVPRSVAGVLRRGSTR